MNIQKITTFCFIISYLVFCHIIWNGCYNIYSTSEDEMYSMLYSKKKEGKSIKADIKNNIKLKDIKKFYVKSTPCPVLPRPFKSIFHLNWFRKSSELIPISIQLYSMFDEKNNFLGFILLCSAIFTIIEWVYIAYLACVLLWDGVIKPLFKILYILISTYMIIKFIVIFLPYTKSYISPENYNYISSFVLNFYNLITKISKELGHLMNKVIQESAVINKEL
ncbi:conserved Plasmodium protein, unknown function [Plasmodium relictum]|uniref:Uncharacterized protein n=1 Tax=Plasmodium relictum TaxID=85471 RepID=A0A1J1HDB6_PLARL|nr:conserved Plasmodium protein, unknown function [Plasmodium relictum]CRH03977.1 conserved Plasmodium protein, unknown function [Plasmodium relictum]